MQKIIIWLMFFAFLIACQKKTERVVERAVPVSVLVIKPDSIRTFIEITGSLQASNDALVYSRLSEEVKEIVKPVGSKVRKGAVIVRLDDSMVLQAKKQAEAALASARARYQKVKQDFERYQRLYKQQAISQQQWQQMQAAMQEAEAALRQMEANLAQVSEQFEHSLIKAPFDGLVGSVYFDVGQMAAAGQPVVKIINPDLMKAKLYIPDSYYHRLKVGQKVYAHFPAQAGKEFTGQIIRIDRAIDPTSRTVAVEAIFPNEHGLLTSGLYGLFKIELQVRRRTVVVPDNAILSQTSVRVDPQTGKPTAHRKYYAFVVKQGRAAQTEVRTNLSVGDRIEVVQGLSFGDSLIVVGQRMIKDGQKTKVVEAY
ncbi:efflux RND transporter periplasmic adaptor subunit [Caldithrix abyssi]